jgi:VWFA-related protein
MRNLRSLGLVGFMLSVPVAGQDATFRTEGRLVEVYASVVDHSGRFIDDLSRDRFLVTDEGKPQSLVAFENRSTGLSCALLLDTTGSMSRALPQVKNAVVRLLDQFRPSDSVAVYGFNESLTTLQDFTTDRAAAKRAVFRTRAEGRTALFDALAAVAKEVEDRVGKKAAVVFTDGDDNASALNLEASTERIRRIGVPVYSVAQGEALLSRDLLRRLRAVADLTGGISYEARKSSDIERIFLDISEELKHSYLLAYRPPPKADRRWRSIAVSVPGSKGYTVRAREGYAPE